MTTTEGPSLTCLLAMSIALSGLGAHPAVGAEVPEFFGLYAEVASELKELRMYDRKDVMPKGEMPRNDAEAKALVERMLQACVLVKGSLRLVLYDDHVAPDKVAVVDTANDKNVLVEWRVAPLGAKQGVYRLAPRADLPPGVYRIWADPSGLTAGGITVGTGMGAKYNGCIVLNTTVAEYMQKLGEGRGASSNPVQGSVTPAAATPATASSTGSPEAARPRSSEARQVTKAMFGRVANGMTWAEVISNLGEPTFCAGVKGQTATCKWMNADKSSAKVWFRDGKVTGLVADRLPE